MASGQDLSEQMGLEVSFEGVHSTAGSNVGLVVSSKCAEPRPKTYRVSHRYVQIL